MEVKFSILTFKIKKILDQHIDIKRMYFLDELKKLADVPLKRKYLHINFEGEGGIVTFFYFHLKNYVF